MDFALSRWQDGEDRNDGVGRGDDEEEVELRFGGDDEPPILGIDQYDGFNPYEEDLSTIDAGSYAYEDDNDVILKTPKTQHRSGDGGETLPESPTNSGSLESKRMAEDSEKHNKRCFLLTAFTLGIILLGSISILSLTLFRMRNSDDTSSKAFKDNGEFFDFEDVEGAKNNWPTALHPSALPSKFEAEKTSAPSTAIPTLDPTMSPTISRTGTPTQSPTMLRATSSPTAPQGISTNRPSSTQATSNPTARRTESPTNRPSIPQPPSNLDVLRERLRMEAPISSDSLLDVTSVQSSVLQWLANDPLIANYTSSRMVQRFALGAVFQSLQRTQDNSTIPNWMTYDDECTWEHTRDTDICDDTGNIISIFLEDVGFSGVLASEISLLQSLSTLRQEILSSFAP